MQGGGGPQQAGAHTSLGLVLHAPNLFVWLKEAQKLKFFGKSFLIFLT